MFSFHEFPPKDFIADEITSKRYRNFYRDNPEGCIEISGYYEYGYYPEFGCMIFYQIIKTSEDSSFLAGNYDEEIVFFMSHKDYGCYPFENFHFEKWWKPVFYEWAVDYEIPIEMMEELTGIPFRENCKESNEYRHKQYEEFLERRKYPFFLM